MAVIMSMAQDAGRRGMEDAGMTGIAARAIRIHEDDDAGDNLIGTAAECGAFDDEAPMARCGGMRLQVVSVESAMADA